MKNNCDGCSLFRSHWTRFGHVVKVGETFELNGQEVSNEAFCVRVQVRPSCEIVVDMLTNGLTIDCCEILKMVYQAVQWWLCI